jgi:membrane protein
VGSVILDAVGLGQARWAQVVLVIVTVVLTLLADWLVFLWVISRLPRERVSARSAVKGAIVASVGFVILQHVGSYYLASVSQSSSFAVLGPILGLLVFANLVSRFLLYVTAWTATAKENRLPQPELEPAVIRPTVVVRSGPRPRDAAGLLGVGAVGALLLRLGKRR